MYTRRLSAPLIILIVLYIIGALVVGEQVKKQGDEAILLSRLSSYADIVNESYRKGSLSQTLHLLPTSIRVTILDDTGHVIYDTEVATAHDLDSHQARPEIQSAHYSGEGYHMRRSTTTQIEYLYYARYEDSYYIRTALPHAPSTAPPMEIPHLFIVISVMIILLMALRLLMITKRYDRTINHLKKLGKNIAEGTPLETLDFPADEVGDVSRQLMFIVEQKEKSRRGMEEARERLIHHFKLTNIGIAIFNAKGQTEFTNSHFIQYANMLVSHPMTDIDELLNDTKMVTIKRFLSDDYDPQRQSISTTIQQNNNIFEVKALRSEGQGCEITITNITEEEKARILKQEMTSNITHEIRTPLSSIRGYLEILRSMNLSEGKRTDFLDKAYLQSIRLSEMMDDLRLISKLDEDTSPFKFEEVDLHLTASEVQIAYMNKIEENRSQFLIKIPPRLSIQGNSTLLYSILQNLVENSLRYGGEGTQLVLECYHQDQNYVYFSYYDTGKGLHEKHLNRIFERFYRADEGRTRASGGSGLGLSIVRNAIHIHSGQVQARTHSSGGLEILFTLHK